MYSCITALKTYLASEEAKSTSYIVWGKMAAELDSEGVVVGERVWRKKWDGPADDLFNIH